jgi:transposase InsO family protein
VLKLVHGDLCGPITPTTPSEKKIFLLLVDDYSRFMWIVLLRSKDQALDAIKQVKAEADATSGRKMTCLHTDRGGEFTSKDFTEYCAEMRGAAATHSAVLAATKWHVGEAKLVCRSDSTKYDEGKRLA